MGASRKVRSRVCLRCILCTGSRGGANSMEIGLFGLRRFSLFY